jgi:hypothetical protein
VRVLASLVVGASVLACGSAGAPTPRDTGSAGALTPTATVATTVSLVPTPTDTPRPTRSTGPTGTPDPNATPTPSPIDLLPFLTAEATVVNLAGQPLLLRVTALDPESDGEYEIGVFELQPEQVTTQLIPPTRFRLDFTLAGSDLATCTIDVEDEEQIQFAAVESGVVISVGATAPEDAAEMVVATASRCRAGETP